MRPYVFKIASGAEESEFFGDGANYVRLDESATVSVTVKSPDNNEQVTLKAGDDVVLTPFDELRLSHDGAGDTVFTLYVGRNTRLGGARIGGSVQVTGGSDNTANPPKVISAATSLYENAYMASVRISAGSLFPLSQLWNPAGSGKLIVLRKVIGMCSSSGIQKSLFSHTTELGDAGTVSPRTRPRYLYGAASVVSLHGRDDMSSGGGLEQSAGASAANDREADAYRTFDGTSVPYSVTLDMQDSPIIIPEGYGVGVFCQGIVNSLDLFFYEEVNS